MTVNEQIAAARDLGLSAPTEEEIQAVIKRLLSKGMAA